MNSISISLLITFCLDFAIQLVAYIISAALQTERFYDLSGSLTYVTCILVALLSRYFGDSIQSLSSRQIIAAVMVLVWSIRLGVFLFQRVLRVEDKRFEEFKKSPIQFAAPFLIQVIWIYVTAFPVFVVLGNESQTQPPFSYSDGVGIVIWIIGFWFEATADYQKNQFKTINPKDFVSTGLWRYSRYANYFGEMTLWIGAFVLCIAGFVESWQWVSVLSPVFVICLLLFVSGVPISEANAQKRYGARDDYKQYVANTSMIIPWPPKKNVLTVVP